MFGKKPQTTYTPQNPFDSQTREAATKFSFERILGYILLFAGLFMIFLAVFLAYNVLTGKSKPGKFTSYHLPPIDLGSSASVQLPPGTQLPEGFQMPTTTGPQFQIPDDLVNDSVALGFYYLLMMFVASAGAKVSGIGIRMIKDIKIKV